MLLVDENQTDMERLIKALGKELSKSQDYSNSSEHKNPKKFQQYIAMKMLKAILLLIIVMAVLSLVIAFSDDVFRIIKNMF